MHLELIILKIIRHNIEIFRRAKEKRLKKDAGRTRWSQYFRSMKGGSSPSKLLDKDELKVDLDSFSHHGKFSCAEFYQTGTNKINLHP